ncbi:hypothetical protein L6164_015251 [Bauhinia variegata]|uniref:Uncharacterized protein n=1 Tax=Bauhinia variegata TaxID=167791 RepID=A0ACB9NNQ8_BAUVA|nr:hypothetical protein L6164_015251 [Bauhinia variegata]
MHRNPMTRTRSGPFLFSLDNFYSVLSSKTRPIILELETTRRAEVRSNIYSLIVIGELHFLLVIATYSSPQTDCAT